jgi:hypothetical protein
MHLDTVCHKQELDLQIVRITVSPFQDYSPYAYTLCRRVRCGLLYQDYNSSEMHPALFPGRFSPPDNTGKLVNQYRKLRSDDAAAKYVKVILLWQRHGLKVEKTKLSNYEFDKLWIRKAEKFAHKLQSTLKSDSKSINRRILIDVFLCVYAMP